MERIVKIFIFNKKGNSLSLVIFQKFAEKKVSGSKGSNDLDLGDGELNKQNLNDQNLTDRDSKDRVSCEQSRMSVRLSSFFTERV